MKITSSIFFRFKKSTVLLGISLFTLFVISITIAEEIQRQNDAIRTELNEKLIKDAFLSEIALFEDHVAKLVTDKKSNEQIRINDAFVWIDQIQTIRTTDDLKELQLNLDGAVKDIEFISLAPLFNASRNLPNRVFMGVVSGRGNLKTLPFSLTSMLDKEESMHIFGWINIEEFLDKILDATGLAGEYSLDVMEENKTSQNSWIFKLQYPSLSIHVIEKNFYSIPLITRIINLTQ